MNAVAHIHEGGALLNGRQLELVRATVASDCNNEEFDLFVEFARNVRLDPFRKQILPLVFNKDKPKKRRMSIVVTRDGLRVIAARCRDYRPASEPATFTYDEALVSDINPKGIVSCSVRLWKQDNKGDWYGVIGEADWDEFAPIVDEWAENDSGKWKPTGNRVLDKTGNWYRMPKVMLQKCAEAQALRAGWPEEFSGFYAEEELDRARAIDNVSASELVEQEAIRRRKEMISNEPSLIVSFEAGGQLDQVPVSKFVDRTLEWARGQKPEEVANFLARNTHPMREFWAFQKGDCLELRKQLESMAGAKQ